MARLSPAMCWLICTAAYSVAPGAIPVEQRRTDSLGREYFLYTPATIDKNKTYWLVVGVHGFGGNGKGAAGLSGWAQKGDCIVVGPSFPNEGYQLLQKQTDEQMVKLFADLKKDYPLHSRLFLYGFSGGAQFAHRFLFKCPELVVGCSAHSGGSWATGGGWGDINPGAADVPLVVSCGQDDTARMHPGAPYSRVEWYTQFEKMLTEKDFLHAGETWPRVGHQRSPGVEKMTLECYALSTQQIPQAQRVREGIRESIERGQYGEAIGLIARARVTTPRDASALLRKVIARHGAQLDVLMAQVEEAGLAKVQAAGQASEKAAKLAALQRILSDFRGAPRTTAAAQQAMKP